MDTATPDADAPVGPWGGSVREPDEPKYAYLTRDDYGEAYDPEAYDEYPSDDYPYEGDGYPYEGDGYDAETSDWDPRIADPGRLSWEPVVGPTEALQGRAGGPGFRVPPGARYGLHDPQDRSAWQRSHVLWEDSGIDWDDGPNGTRPDFPRIDNLPSDAVQALPTIQSLPRMEPLPGTGPLANNGVPIENAVWAEYAVTDEDEVPEQDAMPLSAPTIADVLPRREARPMRPARPWEGHPADLRKPWEPPPGQPRRPQQLLQPPPPPQMRPPGQPLPTRSPQSSQHLPTRQPAPPSPTRPPALPSPTRQPAPSQFRRPAPPPQTRPWDEDLGIRPRPASRKRSGGQQVVRVGLPVVVILAVGAGALAIMTGKAHEALLRTGNESTASSGAPGSGTSAATGRPTATSRPGGSGQAAVVFPGYPGRQGGEQVTAIAAQGTVQLAVGSADGQAAIWRRDGNGPWTLLTADATLTRQPAGAILTSVTHGPVGWLAVGNVVLGGIPATASIAAVGQQPVILTSKDGVTWTSAAENHAFAGPGFTVNSVAANARGYVVVGEQVLNGVPKDAMWWTPDLVTWTRGGDTIATTLSTPGSGMSDSKIFAVAAGPNGFVGVGTHNDCHTAWVSSDGQHWLSYDIPKPVGSHDPLLNHVAVLGNVVVASGDLGVGGSRIPLVVVSKDGGFHWQATPIGNYGAYKGPQGTVTALTSDVNGFLAAGLIGPANARRAVTWTSSDGVTWSAATPASSGTQQITALAAGGGTVSSIATVTAQYGTQSVEIPPAS